MHAIGDDVVRTLYAQWNAGEWGLEHFHPDVEWAASGEAFDETSPSRGRDALAAYWRRFWAAWRSGARWEIDEVESVDEHVLACGRLRVVGRSSGLETEIAVFHLWTVRDELVVRLLSCDDREAALKAARP